jgi:hypothetical protein
VCIFSYDLGRACYLARDKFIDAVEYHISPLQDMVEGYDARRETGSPGGPAVLAEIGIHGLEYPERTMPTCL